MVFARKFFVWSAFLFLLLLLPIHALGAIVDSDNDGMDDVWEQQYFGSLSATPDGDSDNDLLTNIEEFRSGSNPVVYSNIALNKRSSFSVSPSYPPVTDSKDTLQLTDGIFDSGVTTKTVGWNAKSIINIDIVIDLGTNQPISAVKYSVSKRRDFQYPKTVIVEVSEDGVNYRTLGDLVKQNDNPLPIPGYSQTTFQDYLFYLEKLDSYGRYVRFRVYKGANIVILDEIMIYSGGSGTSNPITSSIQGVSPVASQIRLNLLLLADKINTRGDIAGLNLDPEINALDNELRSFNLTKTDEANFNSIFPKSETTGSESNKLLGKAQADLLKLNTLVFNKNGFNGIFLWKKNPWDTFSILEDPPSDYASHSLSVKTMNNQRSGSTIMITNATNAGKTLYLSAEGLPSSNSWVSFSQVVPLETDFVEIYPDMLVPLEKSSSGYKIFVPPGMTTQVWVEYSPSDISPGSYSGKIVLRENSTQVAQMPLAVSISNFVFPDDFSVKFNGWEYLGGRDLDNQQKPVSSENYENLVTFVKKYALDFPLDSFNLFPDGRGILSASYSPTTFDSSGKFTPPAGYYEWFDKWVNTFPDSKKYLIFWGLTSGTSKTFGGANYTTQPTVFRKRLIGWIEALEDHIVNDLHRQPDQFVFFPVDEVSVNEDAGLMNWLKPMYDRPIKHGSKIQIYLDPSRPDPNATLSFDGKTIYDYTDIITPSYGASISNNSEYNNLNFISSYTAQCKDIGFYYGIGPGSSSYSRGVLPYWVLEKYGGKTIVIYSLIRYGLPRTLNFYSTSRSTDYSPIYLYGSEIYSSKRFEGLYQGRQDAEYIEILRSFRNYLSKNNPSRTDLINSIDSQLESSLSRTTAYVLKNSSEEDTSISGEERDKLWDLIDSLSKELNITNESVFEDVVCVPEFVCGDGVCSTNESASVCSTDCGVNNDEPEYCGSPGNFCTANELCVNGACVEQQCQNNSLSFGDLSVFERSWFNRQLQMVDFMLKILEWKNSEQCQP